MGRSIKATNSGRVPRLFLILTLVMVAVPLTRSAHSQAGVAGIAITAPPDGSVVAPGEVVSVTVEPVGGLVVEALLLSNGEEGLESTTAPFTFSLPIPNNVAGPLLILAAGRDTSGTVHLAEITVNVEPAATLQALTVEPSDFQFFIIHAKTPIAVSGIYSDGIERDLRRPGTGTTYESSNGAVVTVDPEGLMNPQADGEATITVSNSGISVIILVTVEADPNLNFCGNGKVDTAIEEQCDPPGSGVCPAGFVCGSKCQCEAQ